MLALACHVMELIVRHMQRIVPMVTTALVVIGDLTSQLVGGVLGPIARSCHLIKIVAMPC